MKKLILILLLFCFLFGVWFLYSEIYTAEAVKSDSISFQVEEGESVSALADRLAEEQVVRHAWAFKKYVAWKGIDKDIRFGTFHVETPITLARVVESLANPSVIERTITILPGWNLRDVAEYFEKENIGTKEEFYSIVGKPVLNYKVSAEKSPNIDNDYKILQDKLSYVSYEGYLAPETYRVYKDASLEDVVDRLLAERENQFTDQMYRDIEKSERTVYEVMTLASIVEREVRTTESRKHVADIFWRRYDINWALQADSTVHYVVGTNGSVFTTREDRDSLSLWNTYKHPGLPLGPISNPSLDSIMATIYPEANDNWYFLTTFDGELKYAKTLEGHNVNVQKYLR